METEWTTVLNVPSFKPEYVAYARQVGATEVCLSGSPPTFPGEIAEFEEMAADFSAAVSQFHAHGLRVCCRLGQSIGHGGILAPPSATGLAFQPIVGPEGNPAVGTACPLDPDFVAHISRAMALLATSGADVLVFDDDFRLSHHGPNARFGCFCPLHLEQVAAATGQRWEAQTLARVVLEGGPSEIRDVWLGVQRKALLGLACAVERAVHAVNSDIRLGLCGVITHFTGHDGVEPAELCRALAGPTKPYLRTSGAPYWARMDPTDIPFVVSYTRLQVHWLQAAGMDIVAEGDTWPRTRFHSPASFLNGFQEALVAAGAPGNLMHAFPERQRPGYEKGYLDVVARNLPRRSSLREARPAHAVELGVTPLVKMGWFRHWDPRAAGHAHRGIFDLVPGTVRWLNRLGVPLALGEEGATPLTLLGPGWFGETRASLERLLRRGALIDAVAARRLMKMGIDVGVAALRPAEAYPLAERYDDEAFHGALAGEVIPVIERARRFYHITPKAGARPISTFLGRNGKELFPGVLLYENAAGMRFCLVPFEVGETSGKEMVPLPLFNYARQEQLIHAFAWLGRRPFPVAAYRMPDLHLIALRDADSGETVIYVQNAHPDVLASFTLRLDRALFSEPFEIMMAQGSAFVRAEDYSVADESDYILLTVRDSVPTMGMTVLRFPRP